MARTSRKHMAPSEHARRGRARQKAADELRAVGKTYKQRRSADRAALRKEFR